MMGLRSLVLFMGLVLSACAGAVIETYEFSAPHLELRYQQLSAELRCPKCQNQNIADSNAPIAQDLRQLLYRQLESGASDEEILQDMVSRYGEFVRYRPKFDGVTAILWLTPVVLLGVGFLGVILVVRSKRKDPAVEAAMLSDEEKSRVEAMLEHSAQRSSEHKAGQST